VSKDEEGTKKDDDAVGDSNGGAPDMVLNANVRTPYVTFDSSSDDGRAPREAVVVDELAPPDGASVGDGGPEGIFDADCAIAADAACGWRPRCRAQRWRLQHNLVSVDGELLYSEDKTNNDTTYIKPCTTERLSILSIRQAWWEAGTGVIRPQSCLCYGWLWRCHPETA
jgi:hypothetical protein